MYYCRPLWRGGRYFRPARRRGCRPGAPSSPASLGDEDVTFRRRAYSLRRSTAKSMACLRSCIFGASVRNSPRWRRSAVLCQYRKRRTCRRSPSYQFPRPHRRSIGEDDTFWGLEAAALWGPFALQGEYAQLDVDLPGGAVRSFQSTSGRTASHLPRTRLSAIPILRSPAGMSKEAGSSAATRPMSKRADGAGRRFTTRCSTAAVAGALWQVVGKYRCPRPERHRIQ